ncbi:MAG: hypothetical protein J6X69_03280 [Bacteroidales bacterium]|nr:hypothetical protein [Bacteroidales bacterium]
MNKSLFVAALSAMLILGSCMKEAAEGSAADGPGLTFFFSSVNEDVKSYFGDKTGEGKYPVLWSGNEKNVYAIVNNAGVKSTPLSPQKDSKNATFELSLTQEEAAAITEPMSFIILSPSSAYSAVNSTPRLTVDLFSGQTPLDNSPDENAQLLYAKTDKEYYKSDLTGEGNRIPLNFKHIPAYFLLTFTGIDLGEGASLETVQSISIESSTKNIAGRFYYYLTGRANPYLEPDGTTMTKVVTANTSKLENVWFALAPADLTGETLTFSITTDKGIFSKSIDLPEGDRNLSSGKIYKMTVNMSGAAESENVFYRKVTDFSTLAAGDEVIIVADAGDYAISTMQNQNNRSGAGVAKSGDLVIAPPANTEIIKLYAGVNEGEWGMYATRRAGYLYAQNTASEGSNLLRTDGSYAEGATPPVNGSWTIDDRNDGKHSAFIQRTTTPEYHSTLGFNASEVLFTAYNPGTIVTYNREVYLYRKVVPPAERLNAELSTYFIPTSSASQEVQLTISGADGVAWTASVLPAGSGATFKGTGLSTSSGEGSAVLALNIPAYTDATTKNYTVKVHVDADANANLDWDMALTQVNPATTAVFPIQWSMPASSNVRNEDYVLNRYSGSCIYSDNHQGKMSVVRVSTDANASDNTTYRSLAELWDSKYVLTHYGVYKEDYLLFEIYNVDNPAGSYTLDYKAVSSGNGPKYFLLEYSLDGGENWTAFPGYQTTTFTYGDYTESTVNYSYYINDSSTLVSVNQSVSLPQMTGTLLFRARVSSASRVSGSKMYVNHGANNRIGHHVTISFTPAE